jgi:DNA-binding CsgD family transcriptional regulator
METRKDIQHLSPRQKRLLRRLAQGKTDRKIAQEIGGTQQHITAQRRRIMQKLQITSQAQLASLADLVALPTRKGIEAKERRTEPGCPARRGDSCRRHLDVQQNGSSRYP